MNISFVVDKPYQNNKIFDIKEPTRVKYRKLREVLENQGFSINTQDLCHNIDIDIDIAIYFDIPDDFLEKLDKNIKNYALLIESPLIKPNNFNTSYYECFNKIFTWSNSLIEKNKKYNKFIKIQYAFDFKKRVTSRVYEKKKLCSLIVSNKSSGFEGELYSKRKEIIKWFEVNHPSDFDLYGKGWNKYKSNNFLTSLAAKNKYISHYLLKITGNHFTSYRGVVGDKIDKLLEYKFTITFENIQDIPGYITEKIFDAFFADCVPIYLGANDICKYIPKNCFIDMRDFKSYNELYFFLTTMSESNYIEYLNNIRNFLESNNALPFTIDNFVNTIVSEIKDDARKKRSNQQINL
ncbi:glycosyltransferase family 10 [Methylophilaceae bacterium Uisw_099_01]